MSTGTSIILDAYKMIGDNDRFVPTDPQMLVDGLVILLSMMHLWKDQGIELGFIPITEPGEDLNEPISARNAIVYNLAVSLAPLDDNGDNVVGETLRGLADNQYEQIKAIYETFTIPNKVPSSTLPRGSGNSKGIYRKVFFGLNTSVGN